MLKVYFIRHQARGVLHDLPFSEPPTEKQLEAVALLCAAAHGLVHPKTLEPYWIRVVDVEVRGPDFEIGKPQPTSLEKVELDGPTVEARGHVENPKS
jgi:hypothetical protein